MASLTPAFRLGQGNFAAHSLSIVLKRPFANSANFPPSVLNTLVLVCKCLLYQIFAAGSFCSPRLAQLVIVTLVEMQSLYYLRAHLFIEREKFNIYLARESAENWAEPHVPSARTEYYFGFESIQCSILGCVSTYMN